MRKLSLKREALVELSGADLVNVAGAVAAATLWTLCGDTSQNCSVRCQWTFNTCETCYC